MAENKLTWKERLLYTHKRADDRGQVRTAANNAILHIHPALVPRQALRITYTWGLGGISILLFLMLAFTGILLMFRYDASVERAYSSIQILESQVIFGALIRGIHHWSANLLVITVFLHLLRVFFSGGFKKGRWINWIVGVGLLLIVLAFNFTGYLLPWDQLSFWAITVSTSLLDYLPVIGSSLSSLLLGAPEVGQNALRNFYAIHVVVLPVVMVITSSYHFWKIRKNGGISQPESGKDRPVERVTTIPHLVQRELAAAVVVFVGVTLFAMVIPAPLGEIANPALSPNPAKAAWYFLGLQELLLHMDALAALILVAILLLGLILLPGLDRETRQIGIYFRSKIGRRSALLGALIGINLIPLLVVADELWLDLPSLLPGLPVYITTSLMPLIFSLGALILIYLIIKKGLKASHGEAIVGLFSFLVTTLIILTFVGMYFRGPNMRLLLPFS